MSTSAPETKPTRRPGQKADFKGDNNKAVKYAALPTKEQARKLRCAAKAYNEAYNTLCRFDRFASFLLTHDTEIQNPAPLYSAEEEHNGTTLVPLVNKKGKPLFNTFRPGSYTIVQKEYKDKETGLPKICFFRNVKREYYLSGNTKGNIGFNPLRLLNAITDENPHVPDIFIPKKDKPFDGELFSRLTSAARKFIVSEIEKQRNIEDKTETFRFYNEEFGRAPFTSAADNFEEAFKKSVGDHKRPQYQDWDENRFSIGYTQAWSAYWTHGIIQKYLKALGLPEDKGYLKYAGNRHPVAIDPEMGSVVWSKAPIPAAIKLFPESIFDKNGKEIPVESKNDNKFGTVFLPGLAFDSAFKNVGLKVINHKQMDGIINGATVSFDNGDWKISLQITLPNNLPAEQEPTSENDFIGTDFNVEKTTNGKNRKLISDSTGRDYLVTNLLPLEKLVDKHKARRDILINRLDKLRAETNPNKDRINYIRDLIKKHDQKAGKYNKQVKNKREADIHYVTNRLIHTVKKENKKGIAVEQLDMKEMTENNTEKKKKGKTVKRKNKNQQALNRSVLSSSFGKTMVILKQKARNHGIVVTEIDQKKNPSTQTCHVCDTKASNKIVLGVKEWTCGCCGTKHDRTENATKNQQKRGFKNYLEEKNGQMNK